jgi:hypothetical protein
MLAYMHRVIERMCKVQTNKTSKTETAPSPMISVLTHCLNPPRSLRQHLPSPTETNQTNLQPNPYSKILNYVRWRKTRLAVTCKTKESMKREEGISMNINNNIQLLPQKQDSAES